MEKFKAVFLNIIKKILDFVSIVLIILTVLGGVMSIFYAEISTIFTTIGIPQERLAWMTVTAGSIGTVGVILTRVSGGLKQAVILAQTTQLNNQRNFEKEVNVRLDTIKRESEAQVRNIENQALTDVKALTNEILLVKQELQRANEFNNLQAKKYLSAPDRIIDSELKEQYNKFIQHKE